MTMGEVPPNFHRCQQQADPLTEAKGGSKTDQDRSCRPCNRSDGSAKKNYEETRQAELPDNVDSPVTVHVKPNSH